MDFLNSQNSNSRHCLRIEPTHVGFGCLSRGSRRLITKHPMIVVVSIGVHCLEETFAIKPPEWAIKSYMNVRVVNGVPPEGDYAFDKCNKFSIVKYTDKEHEKRSTDPYSCDIFSNFSRGAEEPDLPITAGAGANNSEKAMATGDITSASNPSAVPATSALMADNASILASLRTLRVYLRSYAIDQMVQAASSSAGLRVNAIPCYPGQCYISCEHPSFWAKNCR
ncbi:hypothetical protein CRG98_046458 [Punica granatum]|uniref:Uncharacterized protein n=1 Tax=Punica granatum TaxID=22663 RepID=A0A2I0HN37_PUNGR|nr:hypothetical protein CRG98_046458 [Punica granatum]